MFKGYIPTKGKKPIEPIRGRTEFYPLDEVKHLNSYGGVCTKADSTWYGNEVDKDKCSKCKLYKK